jgi:DNA-binding winged helix-turn-helix (wHTH) protein/TolB-like protein
VIRFADFEVDPAGGELRRAGAPVRVQDLPFRLLTALLERPGQVVSRADLRARLWGTETFVDYEAGLNTAVAKLREALGDSPDAPRFVETVPKRGYRFIAPVEIVSAGPARPAAATWTQVAPPPAADLSQPARPSGAWGAARLAVAAVVAVAAVAAVAAGWRAWAAREPVRVAVALFDNETGDPSLDRLAQVLTDSTVVRLTANGSLAVIGNATVLRTDRPFRDLELIRDTLHADLIVIGQVQRVDGGTRVLAHLIRSADQAHVWVAPTPLTAAGEAALAAGVAGGVEAAVRAEIASPAVRPPRG